MHILLVAPGARHSTYDVFRYWADALGRASGVTELTTFSYHDNLQYHRKALQAYYAGVDTDPQLRSKVVTRASRELLFDVWTSDPDVVLFIDGSQMPLAIFEQIVDFRRATRRAFRIAVHVTEAPYLDRLMEDRLQLADCVLVNDRISARAFDERLPGRVEYWPAAYSRDVHYPAAFSREIHDVYFCGTIFPERAQLLAAVDWGDWNVRFVGPWSQAGAAREGPLLTRALDENRSNAEVARDYRRSKTVLNIHRRSIFASPDTEESMPLPPDHEACSVGPRTVEAAACGAFQVSDSRAELREVFGKSIPVFEGPEHLHSILASHLSNTALRRAKADDALKRVRGMSFDDRARRFLELLEEEHVRSAVSDDRNARGQTSTSTKTVRA